LLAFTRVDSLDTFSVLLVESCQDVAGTPGALFIKAQADVFSCFILCRQLRASKQAAEGLQAGS